MQELKQKQIVISGILKGILTAEKQPPKSELKQLTQGDAMKYRGITIVKNKYCSTWYARYRNNGKQFYVSAGTQQECYNKLKLALKNVPKERKPKNNFTLLEWFNKWLELYKQQVKPNTKKDYMNSLKYLENILNLSINEIKPMQILEELNKIEFERRKQKVYEMLNDVFKKALTNEVIQKNPLERIDKPKHKRVNGLALSNEDEKKLIKILEDKQLDMFLVCLYQGLRHGEVLGLTRQDINFEDNTITINKALNEQNQIDTTKNEYSNRVMPMFDKTKCILEKYKNKQGRLFEINYKATTKIFHDIVINNFPNKKYTTHSLRHTFITKCQEVNIPLHIIQKWVGHVQGSDVTSKVYTHARDNAEQENIYKFNMKN